MREEITFQFNVVFTDEYLVMPGSLSIAGGLPEKSKYYDKILIRGDLFATYKKRYYGSHAKN